MIKFVIFLFPFLEEMVFGKTGDRRTLSFNEKVKRWFFIIFLTASITFNYVLLNRLFDVSAAYVKASKVIKSCEDKNTIFLQETQKNLQLEKHLEVCMSKLIKNN